MPELDDHSTDKLFQTGAERHDFAYNPEAWQQMEGLLDADLRRARLRRWLVGVGLLLTLTTALLLYHYAFSATDISTAGPTTVVTTDRGPVGEAVATSPAVASVPDQTLRVAVDQGEIESPGRAAIQAGRRRAGAGESGRASSAGDLIGPLKSNPPLLPPTTVGREEVSAGEEGSSFASASSTAIVAGQSTAAGEPLAPVEPASKQVITPLAFIGGLPLAEVVSMEQPLISLPPIVRQDVEAFTANSENSIAASVGGGLIYGMVSEGEPLMSQPRLSAEVEYRVGSKLAFGTGLAYNQVDYQSAGEDYDPKDVFWIRNIQPTSVLAQCKVLEIPLSIKYYRSGSRNNTVYGSAGAINYILLREDYDFNYDVVASDLKMNWTEKNSNRHFMGVAHFNLGYQLRLPGRSALRLEGFVHVPLTGIGHGRVNLVSGGFSMNYLIDFGKY